MPGRGAEIGVVTDELVERRARGARLALAELRLREPEHEIGIVLVEPRERLAVLGDGLVVALPAHQLFRVTLAARHVVRDAYLALVTAQIPLGIHGPAQAADRKSTRLNSSH